MVRIDQSVIARYKHGEKVFEIFVDCEKALDYKEGKAELDEVLATEDIFTDVKQDKRASEDDLKEVFGTIDSKEIASTIINKGEVQLTAEHKAKLRDQKRKQIVNQIVRNAVNAQTGHPFPPDRIDMLLDEAKFKVEEFRSTEQQVQEALSKLRPLVPIKFETRELKIIIPSEYAGKSYNTLKNFGNVKNEQWLDNGSLNVTMEIPAGMQEEFENQLNNLTHGENEVEIISKK